MKWCIHNCEWGKHLYLCIFCNFDLNFSAKFISSTTIFLSNMKTDFISSTELKTSPLQLRIKIKNRMRQILFITRMIKISWSLSHRKDKFSCHCTGSWNQHDLASGQMDIEHWKTVTRWNGTCAVSPCLYYFTPSQISWDISNHRPVNNKFVHKFRSDCHSWAFLGSFNLIQKIQSKIVSEYTCQVRVSMVAWFYVVWVVSFTRVPVEIVT